jgi:hypothetical protein
VPASRKQRLASVSASASERAEHERAPRELDVRHAENPYGEAHHASVTIS